MKVIVTAKPNAKVAEVKQVDQTHFAVAVKEPPRGGKANQAIVKALAEHFGVSFSRVVLISGFSSKQKVFEVI